jgi:hypothetical protein
MDILLSGLSALWRVALVALIIGVGLPAVFALGIRSLQTNRKVVAVAADGTGISTRPSTIGRLGAIVCFAFLLAAVAFGIVVIVFGKRLFG